MLSFKSILRYLGNFYIGTFAAWALWVLFIDDNNLRTAFSHYRKRLTLEADTLYYSQKIKEVTREHEEVLGQQQLIEKWAREKYRMRRPGEEVFVIVDEDNQSLEEND